MSDSSSTALTAQNLDAAEQEKFAALARDWWRADGPCRTLHEINPCRLDYVRSRLALRGRRVADVGCGGGILSEGLAQSGASVTGIDAAPELVEVARRHATDAGLDIDYRVATAEVLAAQEPGRYDVVVCMELIEHVPDPASLLGALATLLRVGGTLVLSTLNRTPRAWLLGIVGAEYVLSLLPRGTHDYASFIKPSELARAARAHGLELADVSGMSYNPLTRRAHVSATTAVNYFATFVRGDA